MREPKEENVMCHTIDANLTYFSLTAKLILSNPALCFTNLLYLEMHVIPSRT